MRSLTRLVETDAHEGPVYVPGDDALYFTTQRPVVAIKRLAVGTGEVTTVRPRANVANGMALDAGGRLIVCEQDPAAITRFDPASGTVETLVDSYDGKPLNSPNDVAVTRDGAVWFTDPSYGHVQGFRPRPQLPDAVYRYADGELTMVADGFDKPNGLAFSPREDVLYVGDNGAPRRILAFDVVAGHRLAGGRVVAHSTPEHPDGLKVDAAGRIYASAADGVRIYEPTGEQVDEIPVPGAVNFTFRGRDGGALFITADDAIWVAALDTRS
jgi:gluconolactonase